MTGFEGVYYCTEEGCIEKAKHLVEGRSYCCKHLPEAFKSTSLDIQTLA